MTGLFSRIAAGLNCLAQQKWLRDLLPLCLINASRRIRVRLWVKGDYRKTLLVPRNEGKTIVHILHIGKTGGTAIRAALEGHLITENHRMWVTPHPFILEDVPVGDKVVFLLRDPISRFVSGFLNRLTEGYPGYVQPWTRRERTAFKHFSTPNDLASSLYSENKGVAKRAVRSIKSIEHVNTSYRFWLGNQEYLQSRLGDVLFIGFQETLDRDFRAFLKIVNLPDNIRLPKDDKTTNRTRSSVDKSLSQEAMKNLRRWYARDYELLEFCKQVSKQRQQTGSGL